MDDIEYRIVNIDTDAANLLDVICAEHSVETAHYRGRQYAWESSTQFGRENSHWIEITNWTTRQLRDWLGY